MLEIRIYIALFTLAIFTLSFIPWRKVMLAVANFQNVRITIAQKQAAYYYERANDAYLKRDEVSMHIYMGLAQRHKDQAFKLLHKV